ncbi:baeRF3 domain-containing protein [Sphingobacterium paucimobilis]|uniref:eRF1 domain-containing protein n=1 Tax=Sphingobacterium paucimobilis HER1398 TaxID=1346330 RepID=U2HRD6_9SPHI|nr:hypothetical protein [Sphingobacterium paucimobilis]ERJ58027.1 hypothetical protein M472_04545 [Sphingobacterium paucimobilis HER1398]
MTLQQQLHELAEQRSEISVTLSFNTHRTHPDSAQDSIMLKNIVNEAKQSVILQFDKKKAQPILDRLDRLINQVDVRHNLESLHAFVNAESTAIVRSPWSLDKNSITIGERFAIAPLLKMANRNYEYYILVLSKNTTQVFRVIADKVIDEVKNEHFPFENPLFIPEAVRRSDARTVDNHVREYFNHVDKGVVELNKASGMSFLVVSLEENYTVLQQVADRKGIYLGHSAIDYNHVAPHELAKQAWDKVSQIQHQERAQAIEQLMSGVSQGRVLTDLQEIYRASINGNAELLIVHEDFQQAVTKIGEQEIKLIDKKDSSPMDYDIISAIAWNIRSKNGRVIFTQQDQLKDLGNIALLTRY